MQVSHLYLHEAARFHHHLLMNLAAFLTQQQKDKIMKLYTDHKGTWVGTKKEIKELWGVTNSILISTDYTVDVPTDKPNLLEFLNKHRVGAYVDDAVLDYADALEDFGPAPTKIHPLSCSANPNVYDVRDAVLNCDRKHLGAALAAIISRLHDETEEI